MWCIIMLLKAADERDSSQNQSSQSQQGNSNSKERSPSWYTAVLLLGNSAHDAPGKLTHTTM